MPHLRKGRKSAATLSFVPKGRIAAHGAASFPCAAQGSVSKGAILFHKREWPPLDPPRERFRLAVWGLNHLFPSGIGMPARGFAALGVAIRFDSLLLSAAALPVLWQCGLITVYRCTHQCGEHSNAAFRRQSAAVLPSLAPHDSKARLIVVTTRRDSWRSHVHRTHTAQRVQLFELQTANVGGRGALPSFFLLGV